MPFGIAIEALLKLARVALASLLLVGVPVADAFACAGEEFASHAEVEVAEAKATAATPAPSEQGGEPAGDAQHCIHGHCHHSTPLRTADVASALVLTSAIAADRPENQLALASVSTGLERPPKL